MKKNTFDFKEFVGLCKVLKDYNGCFVKFFGEVSDDANIYEISLGGTLDVVVEENLPVITISGNNGYIVRINFLSKAMLETIKNGSSVSILEFLDLYMEIPSEGEIFSRGWKPNESTYFRHDKKNTEALSITERFFYMEILEVMAQNSGQVIKLWLLIFDEDGKRLKEIMHGNISDKPSLKPYYLEGKILIDEDGKPAIKTPESLFYLTFHEFIGAPSLISTNSGLYYVSDLYCVLNNDIISPKSLDIDSYKWDLLSE